MPSVLPARATRTAVRPACPIASSCRSMAGEQRPRSSKSRWLPTSTGSPPTVASAPRPGSARNPSPAGNAAPSPPAPRMIARATGCSDRASMAAASETHLRGLDAVEPDGLDDLGPPAGQRAGLVERDHAHRGRSLEVDAALDQHAPPRRAGQRRHDRHGRRDDERARTRDHQQDERPVEPVAERPGRTPAAAPRPPRRRRRSRTGCSSGRSGRRRPARAPAGPAPSPPG